MDTIVEASDLTRRYERFALREVNLEIRRGIVAGFFGPNGSGKSTLLKLLARQIPADSGSLRLFGRTYDEAEQELKNRVGYAPQQAAFYPARTVQWTARFAAGYFSGWDDVLFARLVERFEVSPQSKVRHLSGGQAKLLSLALALSHGAELLVLDEPTAGLDVVHRRALVDRLRAFVADGDRTVILASNVTDGLEQIADEVWFIAGGRIALREDRDDLLSRWKWIHFKEGALPAVVEERLVRVRRLPYGSVGLTGEYPTLRDALAHPLETGDARLENASLEDVLLSFVKES